MNNEVTTGQEIAWVSAKHSRMVGSILDQLEVALPEGAQCDKLKKLVQVPLYNFRQEIYELITGKIDLSREE